MKRIIINSTNRSEAIKEAVAVLKVGGIVIFPTETCYGVAANATNQDSVDKMLAYKRRPEGKAISIAVNSPEMAAKYVSANSSALDVYDKFLPGPVTVISKSLGKVAKGLEAENGTLGIRIPDYQLALDLVTELGGPISASSANSSGKKTPYTIEDILDNLSKKQKGLVDLILDVGELEHNPPSTVIDTTKMNMQVLREGSIRLDDKHEEFDIESAEEMQELGEKLILQQQDSYTIKPLLILFNADLGAGKTQFTKGVAKGLGITEVVTSPTYTLIEEYPYKNGKLIHFDAWRIERIEELEDLEIEKEIKPGNVIVIEWAGATASFFEEFIKNQDVDFIEIHIDYTSLTARKVKIFQ